MQTTKNHPIKKLTKENVLNYLTMIGEEYGDDLDIMTSDIRVQFWYDALVKYPFDLVDQAFANVMQKSEYKPRLANICNEIRRLQSLCEKTDEELWSELAEVFYDVEHNANGYIYTAKDDSGKPEWQRCMEANQRIYDGLSPELKAYVRNVSELVEIARKNDEGRSIERAMFKKRIGQIRDQERLRKQTPKELLELISNSASPMMLAQGEQRRLSVKSDKRLGE